jgi:DnaJ-domain-containing protein 1
MNPIERRGQLLLALAAAEQGVCIEGKRNKYVRLKEAKQLLQVFESMIERASGDDDQLRRLRKRKSKLEREIERKEEELFSSS